MKRKHFAGYEVDKGRFSSAIRADKGNAFALLQGEVPYIQNLFSLTTNYGVMKLNKRRLRFHSLPF